MNRLFVICCCLGIVLGDFPYPPALPLSESTTPATYEETKPYPPAIPAQSSEGQQDLKPYPAPMHEYVQPLIVQQHADLKRYPSASPIKGPPQSINDDLKPYPAALPVQEFPKIDLPAVTRLPAHNLPKIELPKVVPYPRIEYSVPSVEYAPPVKAYGPPSEEHLPLSDVYGQPKIDVPAVVKLPSHNLPKIELPAAPAAFPYPAAEPIKGNEIVAGPPAKEYGPPAEQYKEPIQNYEVMKIDLPAVTKLPSHDLPRIHLPAYAPLTNIYPAPRPIEQFGLSVINYAPPTKVYGPPAEEYEIPKIELPAITKIPSSDFHKLGFNSIVPLVHTYPTIEPFKDPQIVVEYEIPTKLYSPLDAVYEPSVGNKRLVPEYGLPKVDLPAVTKLPSHDLPKIQLPYYTRYPNYPLSDPVINYVPQTSVYGPPKTDLPATNLPSQDLALIKLPSMEPANNVEIDGPPNNMYGPPSNIKNDLSMSPTSRPLEEPEQETLIENTPAKEYGPPKVELVELAANFNPMLHLSPVVTHNNFYPYQTFSHAPLDFHYGVPEINALAPQYSYNFHPYKYETPLSSFPVENVAKHEAPVEPGTPFPEYGPPREEATSKTD